MKRYFRRVSGYEDVNIPIRATRFSAGYDFEAAEDVTIPSMLIGMDQYAENIKRKIDATDGVSMTHDQYEKLNKIDNEFDDRDIYTQANEKNYLDLLTIMNDILDEGPEDDTVLDHLNQFKKAFKPILVPTGIKAKMPEDEMLLLYNRSSNPLKRFLFLANGVGVVDSDYYNNEGNEGHIQFQFINLGPTPITIKKGERIGQGIFQKFLLTTDPEITQRGDLRLGGFGSTNKEDK